MRSHSGSAADRVRKKIIKIFKTFGLKITVQTNVTSADFLDVILNLETGKHQPYRKPNDEPLYIHVDSNHTPSIVSQIPASAKKRISPLSADEETFEKAALNKSGFKANMTFRSESKNTSEQKRRRRKKTIWFNPPFSKTVQTNVGKAHRQTFSAGI